MPKINLDHMSANPLLPEVKTAMIDAIGKDFGNPASQHSVGETAAQALDAARQSVARLLNCADEREVVFTSCGTESVNHAIKGAALSNQKKGNHIITSNIEHTSVNKSLKRLKTMGYHITSVSVDKYGRVDPHEIADAITDKTILVSIMHSNNEIGTIQPIEEIARIVKEKKILLHTDAVDSVGVVPIDVQRLGADLVSFSSNTFHGPTGVGGLYIRRGTPLWPLLDGGMQENNKRAGAENLVGIIGTGVAAEYARKDMDSRIAHARSLRRRLIDNLPNHFDEYVINGHPEYCLPNLVSISIKYIEGESIVLMLDDDDILVSTRSACATGSLRASHVLLSIGLGHADAQGTLVATFGIDNTEKDVDDFLTALEKIVKTLRDMSPLYKKKQP